MKKVNLTLSEEQLKQIKEQMPHIFKTKMWKPRGGEKYYLLTYFGSVEHSYFNSEVDITPLLIGNVFQTRELAQKELDKRLAIQRVKVWIDEELGMFEPDWDNYKEEKVVIAYSCHYNGFEAFCWFDSKQYSSIGYLRTKEDAEKLIKACEDDLILIYKKYEQKRITS